MRRSKNHLDDLIIRFLDDSITPEEKAELGFLVEENDEVRQKMQECHDIWNITPLNHEIFEPEKAFRRFTRRIEPERSPKKVKRIFKNIVYFSTGVAAAVLVVFFLKLPWIQAPDRQEQSNIITFIMPDHAKGNLKLPDQTSVWLNKNSRLDYPGVFASDRREVSVDGEAYFEVSEDKNKPFTVDLGNEKITVLGTAFNVKNRHDKEFSEITLLSGSIDVSLEKEKKHYELKPNERLVYSKRTGKVKIESVDAGIYNIWIKDRLSFDNQNLSYIISCLEKWYDIKIECTENIKKINGISLSVRDEPVEEVLKGIQYIAPIKYTILKNQ